MVDQVLILIINLVLLRRIQMMMVVLLLVHNRLVVRFLHPRHRVKLCSRAVLLVYELLIRLFVVMTVTLPHQHSQLLLGKSTPLQHSHCFASLVDHLIVVSV